MGKNEEDPIENKGARVVKTVFIDFSDARSRAANSVGGDGILTKFKLIQAFYGCPCYLQE